MKLNLDRISERQQIVVIILLAGLIILGLWFFLLMPQNRNRKELEKDIANMRNQLERRNYLRGETALLREKQDEANHNVDLYEQWEAMKTRLTGFPEEQEQQLATVGHIDYKVALYEVRQGLERKSKEQNISLPYDLGMDDAVRSDEDARKLMLQLKAVQKLVDLVLRLQISTLHNIAPLPPIQHAEFRKSENYLEEYPIRLEFYGSVENLYDLLEAVLDPNHVFVLKALRVETVSPERPDLLNVNAVVSALLFLRDPGELEARPKRKVKRLTPLGH